MGRAKTKSDLIDSAKDNYEKLKNLIIEMSETELITPFDFSDDLKKKEAHWSRDKNVRDILIHLHEWHQLLLNWVSSNLKGNAVSFLPEPYNWKTYGDMNVEFWKNHQNTDYANAEETLEHSHKEVLKLAENFSDEELFTKNIFGWVGGSTLGSYFVSVTASHYDWAIKKLKAHKKRLESV